MFKKFMELAEINKTISMQRKLAQSNPETGWSAMLSFLLENEAKGTFKNYPKYTRNLVNNFFVECVNNFRQTEIFRINCKNKDPMTVGNDYAVYVAVIMQAVMCQDLTKQEAERLDDNDNLIKVLVNLKLLPERCLNNTSFDMRVA